MNTEVFDFDVNLKTGLYLDQDERIIIIKEIKSAIANIFTKTTGKKPRSSIVRLSCFSILKDSEEFSCI